MPFSKSVELSDKTFLQKLQCADKKLFQIYLKLQAKD